MFDSKTDHYYGFHKSDIRRGHFREQAICLFVMLDALYLSVDSLFAYMESIMLSEFTFIPDSRRSGRLKRIAKNV